MFIEEYVYRAIPYVSTTRAKNAIHPCGEQKSKLGRKLESCLAHHETKHPFDSLRLAPTWERTYPPASKRHCKFGSERND